MAVVQHADRLVPGEEREISRELARVFENEGITLHLGAAARRVDAKADAVRVTLEPRGAEVSAEAERLLIAAGRRANTDDLGLEAAGVKTDDRDFIRTDDRFRTSADGVVAIGDVTGIPTFTDSARDDADLLYRILVEHDPEASAAGRIVPHAVFTDPESTSVGLTEVQARAQGHDVSVGTQEFEGVARARAMHQTSGLIKIVADAGSRRILGAHIIGPDAGNLIHELVLGMVLEATVEDVARTLHIHPTLSEGLNAAAGAVHRPAG